MDFSQIENLLKELQKINVSSDEKIIDASSPKLVSITFLDDLKKMKEAVVRITFKDGKPEGTGFLITNNYIITNRHVLVNSEKAKNLKIQFNYEDGIAQTDDFDLDETTLQTPDFALEGIEYDWAIIKVIGNPSAKYSTIKLSEKKIQINDYIYIIQHPQGRRKEISLPPGVVVQVTDATIQYTTDTDNGSSGSPIFNSKLELVGLHKGGSLELLDPVTNTKHARNQGIPINKIIAGIKDFNLWEAINKPIVIAPTPPTTIAKTAYKVFINFSQDDKSDWNDIKTALGVIIKIKKTMSIYELGNVQLNEDINTYQDEQLASSDAMFLIISNNFLVTDECMAYYEKAKSQHKKIIPILLSESLYKEIGDLKKITPLPRSGKPINNHTNKASVLNEISTEINQFIAAQLHP